VNGVLLFDKPDGPTSHDMVSLVRRAAQIRRVGHAGTLDPFATGLLVMLVGQATKLSPYLLGEDKTYLATLKWGSATDSLDRTGEVTETSEAPFPTTEAIRETAEGLVGSFWQVPPMYSAKKVGGKALYQLARAGKTIDRAGRDVRIAEFTLVEADPESGRIVFRIVCEAGTYVRVVADHLARELGGLGHLTELRREKSGRHSVADALTPEKLAELAETGKLAEALMPLADAVAHLPGVFLTERATERVGFGHAPLLEDIVRADAWKAGQVVRLLDGQGWLLALAEAMVDSTETTAEDGPSTVFALRRVIPPGGGD
jgi:tRNA pseudouridine55 synthase